MNEARRKRRDESVNKMTDEQCYKCKYADSVKFYDGGDMFTCAKDSDPNMPFNMTEDTFCPCFEREEEEEDE